MRRPSDLSRRTVWLFPALLGMGLLLQAAGSRPLPREGGDRPEPLPSRWMAADGSLPRRHAVPARSGPFLMRRQTVPGPFFPEAQDSVTGVSRRVALIVEDGLYPSIQMNLTRFVQNIQKDGYVGLVFRFVSGTPESLRTYLAARFKEKASLCGAILIGDIPYIIYELMEDWDGEGGDPPAYDDFPCDLFYMDLDGAWSDSLTDGDVRPDNGKYDGRSGDLGLEIWTGRLHTGNLPSLGTEAGILNAYFGRNDRFRRGTLRTNSSALVYDDDDWWDMGPDDRANFLKLLPSGSVTLLNGPEATTAADYKTQRMPLNQEFIFTRSHGWPGGHGYYRNSRTLYESVTCDDYRILDPPALFYSLFVCSGCDYTAIDYLGGTAAFNERAGLLAWGSSKTGGMWADEPFYATLAEGLPFGTAFVNWFNSAQASYPSLAPSWWYGMVLIGDPTLHPAVAVSGTVKTGSGAALKEVTVSFSGAGPAVTDAKGRYSKSLLTGWSGTAVPAKTGYAFQPASRNYSKLPAGKTGHNYKAVKR